MKFVVLGAGKEGKITVRDLVESEVQEVVIGDYDKEKADSLVQEYEGEKTQISAEKVDANNHEDLIGIMEGADVVANTIGPFYEYGTKILKVAIDAGTDFVDICDDTQPMKEELELDEKAEGVGITAIVGIGLNPGMGNMIAKYGAEKLNEVDEIHFYWLHPAASSGSSGSKLKHALQIFSGEVITYEDNEWVEVQAGSGKEKVDFPEPVGEIELYYSGHPEPITVSRYIDGVEKVSCKGGVTPSWANQDLRTLIDYGFASLDPIDVNGDSVVPREFLESFLQIYMESQDEQLGEKASRVVVKGKKDGADATCTYDRIGKRWTAGLALSIGAQLLAENEMEDGVYPPEATLDSKAFLEEISKRGLKLPEKVEISRDEV